MKNSRVNAIVQIFNGPDQSLQGETWPLPETVGEGEVLVEITLATICGSDLHTLSGQRKEATPTILGHEAVGRIVKVGSKREGLAPGDRVTWTIADSCGTCPACTEHKLPQKCQSLFKYGHAPNSDGTGFNGCYASHIVLRQGTHIVKVPDSLPDRVVVSANCALATVINAVSRFPDSCHAVLIQGAGLLGLYACALLRERGVEHVFCVDIQEQRLAQIERFGGIPIDGRAEHYPQSRERILAVAEYGLDAVLEVAGVAALIPEGIRLLRSGGYYGLVGMVHPNTQLALTGEQIIRKNLTLYGIHNYAPWHLEEAVQFLQSSIDKYPFESLVSPPFPLAKLEQATRMAQTQEWGRVSVRA